MANKLRKDDNIIVIAGKDKGRLGKVLKVFKSGKILVEGVNIIKKHLKPNPQNNTKGGIVEREAPLHSAKVLIVDPASGKGSRVGFKILENGRKVRILKSSGEVIDV